MDLIRERSRGILSPTESGPIKGNLTSDWLAKLCSSVKSLEVPPPATATAALADTATLSTSPATDETRAANVDLEADAAFAQKLQMEDDAAAAFHLQQTGSNSGSCNGNASTFPSEQSKLAFSTKAYLTKMSANSNLLRDLKSANAKLSRDIEFVTAVKKRVFEAICDPQRVHGEHWTGEEGEGQHVPKRKREDTCDAN